MKNYEAVVLGGGISGLSLAYNLKKKGCDSLAVLEKEDQPGGVIGKKITPHHIFYKGPKTFKTSTAEDLLELIHELGLANDLLFSKKSASKRYIYSRGVFHEMGLSFFNIFKDPWMRQLIKALVLEPFKQKKIIEDESIDTFFRRRFGSFVTEHLIDPFVQGVCGGKCEELSMSACFPLLKEWEYTKGSLLFGAFFSKKKQKKSALFSLQGGLISLVDRLASFLKNQIITSEVVLDVCFNKGLFHIKTSLASYQTPKLFSTLAPLHMKEWSVFKNIKDDPFFEKVSLTPLIGVSFFYEKKVIPFEGFGYLVPSRDQEPILGVLFDSQMFETCPNEDELTVMLDHRYLVCSDETIANISQKTLKDHLGIDEKPKDFHVFRYQSGLTHYPLFHKKIVSDMQEWLNKLAPGLILAGNYLHPPGVNHCISQAKKIVN